MVAAQVKLYTVEEYFELDKNSNVRYEFVNGQIFEMAGESRVANNIVNNVLELIRKPLIKKGYWTYTHDVKTIVRDNKIYRYPDLVITSESVSDGSDLYLIKKPVLLIEVASEDSSTRDRETKLQEYTDIDTVKYYVIIDQTKMFVEIYTRNGSDGAHWYYDRFFKHSDVIEFPFLNCKLSLADIYEFVNM
jgi:Uma2 family endonuclease